MTANQLRYHELRETNRSNKVRENETQRHNLATEVETQRSNISNELNNRYATNKRFQIDFGNLLETQRANRAREFNTQYSNYTQRLAQQETARANRASEALGAINAQTNIVNSLEGIRHNKAQESLGFLESDRNYEIRTNANAETHRANLAKEGFNMQNLNFNYANLAELRRHNQTVEGETKRHNLIGEMQRNVDLINDANSIKFNTLSNVLRSTTSLIRVNPIGGK